MNKEKEKHSNYKSKSRERKSRQPLSTEELFKKSLVKHSHENEKALDHKDFKKKDDNLKKSKERHNFRISRHDTRMNFGDGNTVAEDGKIYKYVFDDDDGVTLKLFHYSLISKDGLLTLYDPKKHSSKRCYLILSSKEIFCDHIKEQEAFQLKVKRFDKKIISDLILKPKSNSEKYSWLEGFGIKMSRSTELLKQCIEEVEKRRFCKGEKKRDEIDEMKTVDIETLLRALEQQSEHQLKLTNNKQWNLSRIEKLIQVLLNEIPQPLIPFQLQEILERSNDMGLKRDYSKILKRLPMNNHKMLQMLMNHLENLTNYYANQLNASPKETKKIRQNICSRLTPLIIRQSQDRDPEILKHEASSNDQNIIGKFSDMFYKHMETSDLK